MTYCKRGRCLIKINDCPIELMSSDILRYKAYEPILVLGRHRFAGVNMRIRVNGGGQTSRIYAIRNTLMSNRRRRSKALPAFYQKYVDEQSKKEIKDLLVRYDSVSLRNLEVVVLVLIFRSHIVTARKKGEILVFGV
ncbi:hypothetical protein AMTRI_Chr09g16350 [Amborella trichopoda]